MAAQGVVLIKFYCSCLFIFGIREKNCNRTKNFDIPACIIEYLHVLFKQLIINLFNYSYT
ncbi:MAG: hypothetical protein A3G33_04180 [Omnitrophica bacterium RIFCSPLOWO2_12_FULL_44_17]|uniref:Uncharacterized protein n=1 Tax=Candidatus Danuiimicrobium aquiferis TaxID=1801832 RepID=A0A1G1KQF8_9BACT|nr:MAG: hypothetical protein A3B72_10385 [Omnitrophica bacterium RIFCSPHIGHO2_02_FULL_45_28]OGW90931.1 MAG: hypothetical protein A3E74_00510 [Omnitrophica bacterium RIFCSPHIGHO2_12_FULL_44_12]OGW95136.1 MAG: hypothetical protein A3G33_04180 [Omnitrophica bacterium RIFCSPLOWO2_12_FULL_44_17]